VTYNSPAYRTLCRFDPGGRALPVVVDNGSTDDTLEIVRARCPEARIVALAENLGYGKALNAGLREGRGRVCHPLKSGRSLSQGFRHSIGGLPEEKHPSRDLPDRKQVLPDGSWQRSHGNLPGIWSGIKDATGITTLGSRTRRHLWPRRVDWHPTRVPYLDGAILAVRRRAFEDVAGSMRSFPSTRRRQICAARLKQAGWGVVFVPQVQVMHVRGADSTKKDASDRFVRMQVAAQYLLASKYLPSWKVRVYARFRGRPFCEIAVDPQAPKSVRWIELQLCRQNPDVWRLSSDLERVLRNWSPDTRGISRLSGPETQRGIVSCWTFTGIQARERP